MRGRAYGAEIAATLSFSVPCGTATSIFSPFLRPSSARPTGRLVRDARRHGQRIGLGRADDHVGRLLAALVLDRDLAAERHGVARDLGRVDHAGGAQLLLELGDLVLEHRLLVLRVVVLGVLRDVAELARLADAVGDVATAFGRKGLELLLELLEPLGRQDDVLLHLPPPSGSTGPRSSSHGRRPQGQARRRQCRGSAAARLHLGVSATETRPPHTIDLTAPFLIGDVEIANRVIVAPMAGVSVQAFRRQGKRFGAGLVCSEMVSACGLTYKNERTLGYLRIASDEHPLAVQVFGSDPVACAEAARMCVAAGADIIDLNMGCPVRKVTKTVVGRLAARGCRPRLPRSPPRWPRPSPCRSRSSCAAACRNGSRSALELGPRLVDVGAMALTLHPRSAVADVHRRGRPHADRRARLAGRRARSSRRATSRAARARRPCSRRPARPRS